MTEATDWLDAIPLAIFLCQADQVRFVNRAAADLMGRPADDLSGTAYADWIDGKGRLKTQAGSMAVEIGDAEIDYEGAPAHLLTIRETPSCSAVAELQQHIHLIDEVLSATPDGFILFDRAGHYLYVNHAGLSSAGLSTEQVTGKTWRELGFPEEAGLVFEQRLEQVFTTGELLTYEEQFPTIDGLHDFITTLSPIHDPDGSVIFMLNTIHDITERKHAEREQQKLSTELEQQTRIFDEVLSTTPDTFQMFDRDVRFLYASPSALRNTDLKPHQVIGKTWRELGFPEENGVRAEHYVRRVFASGETLVLEESFPTIEGLRDYESIFSPLHDPAGEVVSVVITSRDITQRKQIEEALRENQQLLTSIYDTAMVGIAVVDAAGFYVQVNRTFGEIYGYSPAELIGKHLSMIVTPDMRQEAQDAHERFIRSETESIENDWKVRRKDGREIEISTYNNLLVRENGERFRVVVVTDVTAQKQAQRALEASEERLTSILNSMEDAVWSIQAAGNQLLYANPAIETLTGYSADDFTANPHLLIDIVHADDRATFAYRLRRATGGVRTDGEYRIVRRDGAIRWVHHRFWLVGSDHLVNGDRIDGVMTDITDRRQAADQAMQLVLERERVHILSEFVRDASHEFRTPLSVINTHLYLLEKNACPDRQPEYIAGIHEQADRILKLVELLITMSRLDSLTEMRFERLDLNRLLMAIEVSGKAAAQRQSIRFTLEASPDPLWIQGERSELLLAINAVLDNALNYTAAGGQIEVRGYHREGAVVIDVRDSGVGIGTEELPHIFERFYRVDKSHSLRGFGLGLPIARKIVEMHGGRIEVESTPQQGSLFRLIIPTE